MNSSKTKQTLRSLRRNIIPFSDKTNVIGMKTMANDKLKNNGDIPNSTSLKKSMKRITVRKKDTKLKSKVLVILENNIEAKHVHKEGVSKARFKQNDTNENSGSKVFRVKRCARRKKPTVEVKDKSNGLSSLDISSAQLDRRLNMDIRTLSKSELIVNIIKMNSGDINQNVNDTGQDKTSNKQVGLNSELCKSQMVVENGKTKQIRKMKSNDKPKNLTTHNSARPKNNNSTTQLTLDHLCYIKLDPNEILKRTHKTTAENSNIKSSPNIKIQNHASQTNTTDNAVTHVKFNNLGSQNNFKPSYLKGISKELKKDLRKRVTKNYAESSVDSSEIMTGAEELQSTVKVPVPIYKIFVDNQKANKQPADLYEFDEFSFEDHKPKKRKKRDRSSIFDKNTHEILQDIERKEKAQVKKSNRVRNKKLDNRNVYNKRIKNIVTKVLKNIKEQKGTPQKKEKQQMNCEQIVDISLQQHVSRNLEKQKEMYQGGSNQQNIFEQISNNGTLKPQISRNLEEFEISKNYIASNDNLAEHDNLNITEDSDNEICFDNEAISSPPSPTPRKDIDILFGFDDEHISYTPQRANPKVNIISNVILRRNSVIDSPDAFERRRPNANSTMLQTNHPSSPWRFDTNVIKRNPHLLYIKKTALPSISQDMVLDHTLVDSLVEGLSKTPKNHNSDVKRSPVQRSILNYIDTILENQENVHHSSLFDYLYFKTPVKNQFKTAEKINSVKRNVLAPRNENIDKTNSVKRNDTASMNENVEKINSVTRNVLESKNENVLINTAKILYIHLQRLDKKIVEHHLLSQKPEKNTASDITYFGFDDSSFGENEVLHKRNDTPYRFDISLLRKYPSKKKKAKIGQIEVDERIEENNTDDVHSELDGEEVHLFEDPELILDNVSPEICEKRRRRRRLASVNSNLSEYEKPKRKKKDLRTRAEEEEAEKWAAAFNAECAEIEKYELEVE